MYVERTNNAGVGMREETGDEGECLYILYCVCVMPDQGGEVGQFERSNWVYLKICINHDLCIVNFVSASR
jgi:hypothetical protein